MISIDEALQAYVQHINALPAETTQLRSALRRVLAEDQHSPIDLPRFDQSAMDGYALRAADSANAPLEIPVQGESTAGHATDAALGQGATWRIFTGAPLPDGADSVIPQERVERVGDSIRLNEVYPPGRNIRYRGEEIRAAALLAEKGQRLTPGLIASLANTGLLDVRVIRQPRIAVLITGDEIRTPESLCVRALGDAEIPDSNGAYIEAWLQAQGYAASPGVYAADTARSVHDALTAATEQHDLVISTGGASVGDRDFIPEIAQSIGFEQIFWKVAQKPGKPLFLGLRNQTVLLGLPGNPGAVLVGMEVHARCILNLLEGLGDPRPPWQRGRLTETVKTDARRERLLRMRLSQDDEGRNLLSPLDRQDSHMLSNLAEAQVLVRLPSRIEDYAAGSVLDFLHLAQ